MLKASTNNSADATEGTSRVNEYLNMTGAQAHVTFKLDYSNPSAPINKTIYKIASEAFQVSLLSIARLVNGIM
jgi:hypothetical protein